MKTSNKWLMAALLLLLGSLTAYNMGLRAEYKKGAYRKTELSTTTLNFKDFNEVDVRAAGLMGVKVVAGPYGVKLRKGVEEFVKVTQQGTRLTVAVVFPQDQVLFNTRTEVLTISCPQLQRLTVGASYTVKGKAQTNKEPGYAPPVRVMGFRQDSLLVRQDLGSRLELANNQLGYLRAEAGRSVGSQSVLHIGNSNRIQSADLTMENRSLLKLESAVPRLKTSFSDSAQVTLSGPAARGLGGR